jgi:hypothetical protein
MRAEVPGVVSCTWIGPRLYGNSEPFSGYAMVVDPEVLLPKEPSVLVSKVTPVGQAV